MDTPFFSICLPTYNYAHLLPDAIESVLRQTFGDFELLIQDDDSLDDTDAVIARYKDDRIFYCKNSSNLGIFGNLNKLCARANGRYIKILCADDVLSKWCLETIANLLRKECFRYKLVAVMGTVDHIKIVQAPRFDTLETFIVSKDTLFSYLAEPDNWGAGLAELCVERDFFQSMAFFGKFDKAEDFSKDILTWLKMVLKTDVIMMKHPLVFEGSHPGQARYKLARITQLREMVTFFYGREAELAIYPDFFYGRQHYVDRYIVSHYWYGIKYLCAGYGFTYLRDVRRLLRQFGYFGFPWSAAASKLRQRLLSCCQKT